MINPDDDALVDMLMQMLPASRFDTFHAFMQGTLARTPYLHITPEEFRRILTRANARRSEKDTIERMRDYVA